MDLCELSIYQLLTVKQISSIRPLVLARVRVVKVLYLNTPSHHETCMLIQKYGSKATSAVAPKLPAVVRSDHETSVVKQCSKGSNLKLYFLG